MNAATHPDAADARHFRTAAYTLAALTVARLAYLVALPLELVGDEAYYREWGRIFEWGYYSKPPLIGWINALTRLAGIPGEFGLRWPAVFFGSGCLWALFLLVRDMRDSRTGLFAMLLVAAAPGDTLANALLTIDAPLLCAWAFALLAFRRIAVRSPGESAPADLALYVVAVATGVLAKQMMIVFPFLAVAYLAADPARRAHLRRPGLWALLFAPLLALLPPLAWNASHGWVTLEHTATHVHPEFKGPLWSLARAGEFLSGQAGVAGPATFVLFLACTADIFRGRPTRETLFAQVFSLPALLVFLALAFTQRVQPNWPAVFLLGAAVAIALRYAGTPREIWLRRAIVSSAAISAAAAALPFSIAHSGFAGSPADPTKRLRGWRELADVTQDFRKRNPDTFLVALGDRAIASQLAFYLPGHPQPYLWTDEREVHSQFELRPGPLAHWRGRDALIVIPAGEKIPEALKRDFASVRDLGTAGIPGAPEERARFRYLLGIGLKSWTPDNRRAAPTT